MLNQSEEARRLRVAVVSDDRGSAAWLGALLADADSVAFEVGYARCTEWGAGQDPCGRSDVVLVEFPLPTGVELSQLLPPRRVAPCPPAIVIERAGANGSGVRAVHEGAQDSLPRGSLSGDLLVRSIRHAIERHELRRELERQAARLRTVIQLNADGMLVVHREGRILFANPRAEELLGRRSDQLSDWHFGYPVVNGDATEIVLHPPRGGERTAEMRIVEIEWEGATAFLCSLRDVTDRKAVEEELRRYQRRSKALAAELSQAEQRERKYLAQVLHDDLQQILVAVRMNLDMIRRKGVEVVGPAALEQVTGLIDKSIALSRSLVAELSPAILHDGGLAAALAWLARMMKERYGIEVTVEAPETCRVEDEDLRAFLFQAARELLFNAVKHADDSPTRVVVGESDGRLGITVEDCGPGFDPAALEHREDPGGFGLFNIQQRLEFWDGKFAIDSRPGEGCRITLTVPVQ